jgi:hypothetical protein
MPDPAHPPSHHWQDNPFFMHPLSFPAFHGILSGSTQEGIRRGLFNGLGASKTTFHMGHKVIPKCLSLAGFPLAFPTRGAMSIRLASIDAKLIERQIKPAPGTNLSR